MARRPHKHNREEAKMVKTLDALSEFEEFKADILQKMKQLLKAGKSSEEILEFGRALAAARIVSTAATSADPKDALSASRDILDRTQGKAKERTEVEHKFSKLKDEELDALLLSRLKETSDEDSTDVVN